jgi:hypothetical protein
MDHSSRILPIGIRIRPAAGLLALGLCFISSFAAGAPALDSWQPSWSTDGLVTAIIETDRGVVLGGAFELLLPPANHVAFIDPASGVARGPFLNVKGSAVLAAAEDGQGGWFFGGEFESLQGQPRRNLAQVDANGLVTDWNPGTNAGGGVIKLLRIGDRLLVGGSFSTIAGGARQGLAAVHTATGALLPWNPQLEIGNSGGVLDLLVSDTTVFVAGLFHSAGGQPRATGLGDRIGHALGAASGRHGVHHGPERHHPLRGRRMFRQSELGPGQPPRIQYEYGQLCTTPTLD